MKECIGCGFPLAAMNLSECPKCDYHPTTTTQYIGILEVDIAHSGETWEVAKQKIEDSMNKALYYNHRGLKIIHGYGTRTNGKSIIAPRAKAYLQHLAERYGGRYVSDKHNNGVSIVWLNK